MQRKGARSQVGMKEGKELFLTAGAFMGTHMCVPPRVPDRLRLLSVTYVY